MSKHGTLHNEPNSLSVVLCLMLIVPALSSCAYVARYRISQLQNNDPKVQRKVAQALARMGEPAVQPLIAALRELPQPDQLFVEYALGEIRNPRAVEPLVAVLKDPPLNPGRHSAVLLGTLDMGTWAFIKEIGDVYPWKTMGTIELEELEAADHDAAKWALRVGATGALIKIGEPAVKSLSEVLRSEDVAARECAAYALQEITKKDHGQDSQKWQSVMDLLERLGQE